ncbi:hypothetical protein FQN60_005431 [Etheostoma spectabile]|uniref:RAD50-interacting protein 1 n=1 Tax=Etheostoma spectabile TaxID=54343 RepID=A0A5J5CH94_9PERO|nr:hypothetical protein FQN60_005431 [Etheostoma spectabile]
MAASTGVEQTMTKRTDTLLKPVSTTSQAGESFSADSGTGQDYLVDFLEKELGSDLKSLKNVGELLEKLREENKILEEQVLTVSSSVPPKVSAALSAAEEAICSLEGLLQRERLISNMLQQHLQGAQPWMDNLGQTLNQVDTIERHVKYLRCLQHIEELSPAVSDDQQCLGGHKGRRQYGCTGRWTKPVWMFSPQGLPPRNTSLLAQDYQGPTGQSLTPTANAQEINSQLELLVTQLLALQTSDDLISQRALASCQAVPTIQPASSATPLSQEPPLCLPIQLMLLPLSRRFRYHFYGNRQTNSLSKPEWYLTQVLMWMGNSSTFMEEKIQPILDRAGATISAMVELCRGLLSLVQEKVASDASRLLYDDVLFCHLVEEVLQFEKELRSNQSYPAVLPVAVEKMDAMLSAEGAWSSQYKDIKLVDDFRIRLTQVMKEESRCPLGARYCAILNAVNYISTILGDWGDNVFFLQLQQAAVSLGEEVVLGGLGVLEVGRLASLEGSLFEGLLALLDRLKGDMLGRLLEWTMREITEKVKPYGQDRWLSLPPQHDQSTMTLSSSACSMMLCVRDRLLNLHQVLSLSLFQLAWQGLAERLDNVLYQDVILSNHFSEGGAAQLQFDMTRNLFPLFGHYCKRPENFFKHVKEACIILCLNVGSAILLKNLLKESEDEASDWAGAGDPPPESALNELGVYCLAPCDVLILLNLRASWPGH